MLYSTFCLVEPIAASAVGWLSETLRWLDDTAVTVIGAGRNT